MGPDAPELGAAPRPSQNQRPKTAHRTVRRRFVSLERMPLINRNFLIGLAVNPLLSRNSVISWASGGSMLLKCDAFS